MASSPFFIPNSVWGQNGGSRWFCVASASIAAFATVPAGEFAIMAWLEQRGNQFHIGIRIGDRKIKRSLQTVDPKQAEDTLARVERRLKLIEQGDLILPEGADLLIFVLSDGKLLQPVTISTAITLEQLCQRYLDEMPAGTMEVNTVSTLKIHLTHLRKILGEEFNVERLQFADLQRYVDTRSSNPGRRGNKVGAVTIKKELCSFSGVWSWGTRMGIIKGVFPNKGLRFTKTDEKPPFQTWAEIERQIELGGLSEHEQEELWDGLYLTAAEIDQVLDYVMEHGSHPTMYPMLVIAAHTGARRSEIVRSEVADFDLQAKTVRLRELKKARGKRTTRIVPMSKRLCDVMESWLYQAHDDTPFRMVHSG